MERKELIEKANELGLEFPKNITTEKLSAMVEEKEFEMKEDGFMEPNEKKEDEKKTAEKEDKKPKISPIMAANQLIRCIITPLSNSMKDIPSEMYSVGRPSTGFIKKVVRFNVETREPIAILRYLKGKTRVVQKETAKAGVFKLEQAPAFNIQIIPELPAEQIEKELDEARNRK